MTDEEIVAPYTGAWIEIETPHESGCPCRVAPYTGAWIEIGNLVLWALVHIRSPPIRGRGLKYSILSPFVGRLLVAPYTGAWIEIETAVQPEETAQAVAPYTGAWIEIEFPETIRKFLKGRPLYGGVD